MPNPGDVLYYCTTDPLSRWVSSFNTVLDAQYVDYNFWNLDTRVSALEAGETSGGGGGPFAEIASFTISGPFAYSVLGSFSATLTNSDTIGPDPFPFPMWLSVGAWPASTPLLVGNTFYIDGAVYGVIFPYPGAATFDPNANDGSGHNYFSPPIWVNPSDVLPSGGVTGQYLGKASDADYDVTWFTPELTACADVDIASTGLAIGQVLTWNGTFWINETPSGGGGGGTFESLSDVSITSVSSGQVPAWNGIDWANETLGIGNNTLADTAVGSFFSLSGGTQFLAWTPANGVWFNLPLANLSIAFTNVLAGPIVSSTLGSAGSGYAVNDTGIISIDSGDGHYQVNSIGGGGAVATYTLTAPGTAYSQQTNAPTTVGTGSGDGTFTINITAVKNNASPAQVRQPAVTALGTTGTVSLDPTLGDVFTVTPTGAITLNAVSAPAGALITILVLTSGASSYNITPNTNFISQGALATGTSTGAHFTLTFRGDGTNFWEVGRTPAM